ncbi:hypothetical protein [Dyadobacter luticola]|uniref:Porin family protein n=1 Tax=Dyadobacter luticola TaxID=1979387 RepID=A0A5R9KY58_9BACT|nr:hypothetical protein [Dyadobacter luticola]TLV01059.1 hypothetical protein FEN17_16505 [Dyadobacter luticola]
MKKIILFTLLISAFSVNLVSAQFTGKRFISGEAAVTFGSSNPDESKATNGYGYGINVNFGKFKTETRASGWNLSTSLQGRKEYYNINNVETSVNGIRSVGGGIGHFWHFYKHFNDNFGIFGGPGIALNYVFDRRIEYPQGTAYEQKNHTVSASLDISAGGYYKLNERWWLLASLGFSQPVGVSFSAGSSTNMNDGVKSINHGLSYGFSPQITFPSVGLGLRYFFRD